MLVPGHYGVFENQQTNWAVKSLTDNNLKAIVFITKIMFTARHDVDVFVYFQAQMLLI